MRVCLFESRWEALEPLSCTRPVFELRCGMTTLEEKQRRWWATEDWGVCLRPELAALYRLSHPRTPVNEFGWLLSAPAALVNGRWLPPARRGSLPDRPCLGLSGGQAAWLVLGEQQLPDVNMTDPCAVLAHWRHRLPCIDVGGTMIETPWHLIDHNADALRADFASGAYAEKTSLTHTVATIGPPEQLWIAPSARVEPQVVADTTHGPVVVDDQALVTAFTRLEGPCYIGPLTQIHGANIRGGTTIGPHCRVGGEVEASILHGFSNKHHEGFLGHSYVGEWVNLGAGTHTSDLRNDYGPVHVPMAGGSVNTGRSKVGSFIGDHVKTGLGTLLNTGSHLGAFSNLLPSGRLAPKFVPAFAAWWNGELREQFGFDQQMQTAQRMMARRDRLLTNEHLALYQELHAATAEQRKQLLLETPPRVWRRSA